MNITLLCVGRIKEAYFADAIAEYKKRLSRYAKLTITETTDEKLPALMERFDRCYAMAIEGEECSSEEFAAVIKRDMDTGKSRIAFLIGGSEGLSEEVKKKSDKRISFSRLTFPHRLMRVILLEQIYRAFRIIKNEPYHK